MTPEFPYVQLPGGYRGFLRKASLWEGADHILSVKGTRFSEEYRRFYYRDIQALIVEKRARAGSLGWWVILLGLFLASLIAAAENSPPYSGYAAIALLILVVIRFDLSLRRSCRFSIQTAVSREQLPSLIRRVAAEAVVARLSERISSEQGDLPDDIPPMEEEVLAAIRPADRSGPPSSAVLDEEARKERKRAAASGVNLAVAALFILLLNCVFTFWFSPPAKYFSANVVRWVGYSFIAVQLIPVFLALRHSDGIKALTSLRNLMIALIIFGALRFSAGLAMPSIYQTLVRLQGFRGAQVFTRYYSNVNGGLQLAFAAAGLILIFAKWETYRGGELSRI